ncbi:YdeI/OmpD-associated family protein [Lysobacter sp. CA196]|uniref:YdeI/OmpD-associated family protein n=1 Tax=Lysobacter sp. CA196 TaxID=3455606 RepID=UPI003F8D1BFB
MSHPDPRIDAYIAKAAPFAQPILEHLRAVVHAACPQVEEAIKWGMPSFVYCGKLMCSMAAFKQHATFGFWQGANIVGAQQSADSDAMGQFGRLGKIGDLPGKRELTRLVKQAMALIEAGVARPTTKRAQAKPPVELPADLAAALALKKNAKAKATYEAFPPSQRREYVEWIESAKREATRKARVAQAVEWMAEGKVRNWKYMAK